jgi:hypothetical protein
MKQVNALTKDQKSNGDWPNEARYIGVPRLITQDTSQEMPIPLAEIRGLGCAVRNPWRLGSR